MAASGGQRWNLQAESEFLVGLRRITSGRKDPLARACYERMLSWKVSGILDKTGKQGGSVLSPFAVFFIFICEVLHGGL